MRGETEAREGCDAESDTLVQPGEAIIDRDRKLGVIRKRFRSLHSKSISTASASMITGVPSASPSLE